MSDFNERMQVREDLMAGKVPKRVPVYGGFSLETACGLAGIDLFKAHYDIELAEKAFEAVCNTFYTDSFPVNNYNFPASYQILGNKSWVLGSSGAVQHPEISPLMVEEYDELIADPYKCVQEKILPRVNTALDTDPINRGMIIAQAYASYNKSLSTQFGVIGKLSAKYGYTPGMITGPTAIAPFDSLSDNFRGFKAVMMDMRRIPDKVEAACNALLPYMVKMVTPNPIRPGTKCFIPLHLAPYMSEKQFKRFYWPTFEKLLLTMDGLGLGAYIFCEQDWTRYSAYLESMPESVSMLFEDGDYAHIKRVVGAKHIIGGFFDPTVTLTRSKEQCIDTAKRLVDTLAPGGRYFFGFNRSVMDIKSVDVPKLQAVLEWVRDNAVY